MVDLHIHTNASDGLLNIEEVIKLAEQRELNTIAITDHDTVQGLLDLEQSGLSYTLQVINGIELSTVYKVPIHILGYGIDIHNEHLNQLLFDIKNNRIREIKKVISLLKENEIDICAAKVIKSEKCLTMDAIAKYIHKTGYADSMEDAYDKYLRKERCGYYHKYSLDTKEAIELILETGGIPVLAHPNRLHLDAKQREELIQELTGYGLHGIEVFYNDTDIDEYKKISEKYQLIMTGGSDFHKPEDSMGLYGEDIKIPDTILANLK